MGRYGEFEHDLWQYCWEILRKKTHKHVTQHLTIYHQNRVFMLHRWEKTTLTWPPDIWQKERDCSGTSRGRNIHRHVHITEGSTSSTLFHYQRWSIFEAKAAEGAGLVLGAMLKAPFVSFCGTSRWFERGIESAIVRIMVKICKNQLFQSLPQIFHVCIP